MDVLEKTISNLIEKQFPNVYQEHGEVFVLFVKKYYEWLETQNQTNFHSRNYFEYIDIDETAENFLMYFKETYLKNIQIDTIHNIKQLIKHSLDLYRAKGSERAIELLFRAVFGVDVEVYYPREDLFKPSDGKWVVPRYIELSLQENNGRFVGNQIKGMLSGAIAFSEKVIRRNIGGKLSDILFISAVKGIFIPGEQINFSNPNFYIEDRPIILGSLNDISIDVQGSGQNYSIGNVVDVFSNSGFGAKATILSTSNISGKANFKLIDGGFGFSNTTSTTYVSEKVITLSNTNVNSVLFEVVSQNIAQINYLNANGIFTVNTNIFAYTSNVVSGIGKILSVSSTNTTAGQLVVEVTSGNLSVNTIYSTGNTIKANVNILAGYTNVAALGTVIGQISSNGFVKLGLVGVNNQFYVDCNTFSLSTNLSSNTLSVSQGSSANVIMYNEFLYPEQVSLNTDLLKNFANTKLNNVYNFAALPTANIATPLQTALQYSNTTFGSYYLIQSINPGNDYTEPPMVKIYDPVAVNYNRFDQSIFIELIEGNFKVGEVISQSSSNNTSLVLSANDSVLKTRVLKLSQDKQIQPGQQIIGQESGAIANVIYSSDDTASNKSGNNATISSIVTTALGAATKLKITSSGYNFTDGELVYFGSGNNVGSGLATLSGVGEGEGYYKNQGGFLSSSKKLFDGKYYQYFSYDVISSLNLETYKELLKNVIHMAGMNLFGTLSKQIEINSSKTLITRK